MVLLQATDDFDVEWKRPEDAGYHWRWDEMHNPRPLVPMSQEFWPVAFSRGLGPMRFHIVIVNGFVFMSGGGSGPPGIPPGIELPGAEAWEQDFGPRTEALVNGIRYDAYADMTMPQLLDTIESLPEVYREAMANTMLVIPGIERDADAFYRFCSQHLAEDGGETLATTMLQAVDNESARAGKALGELAAFAAHSPELAATIRDRRYDDVTSVAGGEQFLRRFDLFIDHYGWRAESWTDLEIPTWAEDPDQPLNLIASYLEDSTRSPLAAQRRAGEQRTAAIRVARAALVGPLRDQFEATLARAERYVEVRESRARLQLMAGGVLRIPLLELGRRFVADGSLRRADDVLYLYFSEVRSLASGELEGAPSIVARRRVRHRHHARLTPPPYLGAPPRERPPQSPQGPRLPQDRMGAPPDLPEHEERTLHGVGASSGVARGIARVVASLDDAARLQHGDVLVCRSTAAPWTPLFAIAAAVVTNTGGVLSHSAIVAREYAIPCVAGAKDASELIPDGVTVTVDGDAGTVTIEDG